MHSGYPNHLHRNRPRFVYAAARAGKFTDRLIGVDREVSYSP